MIFRGHTVIFGKTPYNVGVYRIPWTLCSSQDLTFIHTQLWVPILQSLWEPERAGEARRADSASFEKDVNGR